MKIQDYDSVWDVTKPADIEAALSKRRCDGVNALWLSHGNAALAAACTQRQTEVYRIYTRRTATPTSAAFDNLLKAIWDKIHHRQGLGAKEHAEWQDRAERLYPGEQAKHDVYKGRAQIAVLGLLCSNNVLMTGNTEDTRNAAHEAFMSIYNSLTSSIGQKPQIDLDEPDADARSFSHPLTEAEHFR
jgi:hypothetical protein